MVKSPPRQLAHYDLSQAALTLTKIKKKIKYTKINSFNHNNFINALLYTYRVVIWYLLHTENGPQTTVGQLKNYLKCIISCLWYLLHSKKWIVHTNAPAFLKKKTKQKYTRPKSIYISVIRFFFYLIIFMFKKPKKS